MRLLPAPALHAAVALALVTPAVASSVHLVDSSGGGDFLGIQAAVDAAADGDTILLRRPPGVYADFEGFVVDGKSLSVVNLQPGRLVTGYVTVRGLDAGQVVVLSGLTVGYEYQPQGTAPADALRVEGCAGTVRVQDCELRGWEAPEGRRGRAGCSVLASADVALSGCEVIGGGGTLRLGEGGPGIVASGSRVLLYDCAVVGGIGGTEMGVTTDAFGGPGGDGVVVIDSFLQAESSSIAGGAGGWAIFGAVSEGGDGGAGLRVGAAATATLLDATVAGGEGGGGDTQPGMGGPATIGRVAIGPAGTARRLAAPDRAEEQSGVPLTFRGAPGEEVVLLVARAPRARPVDAATGFLHVAGPFRRLELGPVPASGVLEYELAVPDVPARQGVQLALQAGFVDPVGGVRLSGPAQLYVFDGEAPPVCGQRLYVDASAPAGGDGLGWGSALRDLNAALVLSADCPEHPTEVWVAEGTYRPAPPNGDRGASFVVYGSTRVHGGFAGHETSLDQRDAVAHPVVLSGDLNGDDGPDFSGRDDNAYHVVRAGRRFAPERGVHLDGLTLRGGAATSLAHDPRGGGLLVWGAASVVGCLVTDNLAGEGGGVCLDGDRLDVVDCRLVGNHADGSGGGLLATSRTGGHASVANSILAGNSVGFLGRGGGARALFECTFELRNSVVHANRSFASTSGIEGSTSYETTVSNCILWGNGGFSSDTQDAQLLVPVGSVDYSCVQDLDGSLGGVGNLGLDPLFVDPVGPDGIVGTLDDDLRLPSGSPCVDAGRNADVPPDRLDQDGDGVTDEPLPLDLDGHPRFRDDPLTPDTGDGTPPLVDLGPYERP